MKRLSIVLMTLVATMFAGQSIAGSWSKIRINRLSVSSIYAL